MITKGFSSVIAPGMFANLMVSYTTPTVKYSRDDPLYDICSAEIVPWGRKGWSGNYTDEIGSAIGSPQYIAGEIKCMMQWWRKHFFIGQANSYLLFA